MHLEDEGYLCSDKLSFSIFYRTRRAKNFSMCHWNSEIEILHIISGSGCVLIGSTVYNVNPGETYIINSYEYHKHITFFMVEGLFSSFFSGDRV